jgi:hypothetical protein
MEDHYKYVSHLASGREYFFDLAADPAESQNLIFAAPDSSALAEFRTYVREVLRYQALLKSDRLWADRLGEVIGPENGGALAP